MRARRAAAVAVLWAAVGVALAGPTVTDDAGRRVALDEPARRIVSLAPHVTEVLYAAGAGDRMVAAVSYSDHPPAARSLPRVGSYDHLNIEAILAHEPDLVIAWQSGNPAGQVRRLRALGLAVYITEPRQLDAIASTIERLGVLAGTAEPAQAAATQYRERLARLREHHGDRPTLEVFYQLWNDPLMTISGDHVISDVIRGCGGRNVFAETEAIAPRVSVEAVLARAPEVIVASGTDAMRPQWLDTWHQWPELAAVEHGHLFFVPPDLLQRHSPRILDGMARVCRQLERARREQARQ